MPLTIASRFLPYAQPRVEEEYELMRTNPAVFRMCLNAAAAQYFSSLKRIVHLYCDIITIYSTLLEKIPDYDDVTRMARRACASMARVEEDFNRLFPALETAQWEALSYNETVRPGAVVVLRAAHEAIDAVGRALNCIDVFFSAFGNLRKLLLPSLLAYTLMVQKLVSTSLFLFRSELVADDEARIAAADEKVFRLLHRLDAVYSGILRERRLMDVIFATMDPLLQQYTGVLLGLAFLKRKVDAAECQTVRRRHVCFQAAEHVVSIPLQDSSQALRWDFKRRLTFLLLMVCVTVFVVLLLGFRQLGVVFASTMA